MARGNGGPLRVLAAASRERARSLPRLLQGFFEPRPHRIRYAHTHTGTVTRARVVRCSGVVAAATRGW